MASPEYVPLDQTVEALAENVEKAMDSVYKFQKSLLNRNNADNDRIREVFMTLREGLKKQWEDLRAYLHRCHAFAAEVFMLNEVLGDTKVVERKEILTDILESAEELQKLSSELKSSEVSRAFLSASALHVSTSENVRTRPTARPGLKNANLKAFVDANFAAASTDGNKSLTDADRALTQIDTNIDNMLQFWDFTAKTCQTYLTGASRITDEDAKTITEHWTCYKQALEKAIASIARTNDMILVDAAGTAVDQSRHKWYHYIIDFFCLWLGTRV